MRNYQFFLTGPFCSGKGRVAFLLEKNFGYKHVSLRHEMITYARSIGLILENRDEMRTFANRMRQDHGGDFFVNMAYKKYRANNEKLVIESIRTKGEVSFLRSVPLSKLISIDADPHTRYLFARERGSFTDNVNFPEFQRQEAKELSGSPLEQNIKHCMEQSDISFLRNGSNMEFENHFLSAVEKILSES